MPAAPPASSSSDTMKTSRRSAARQPSIGMTFRRRASNMTTRSERSHRTSTSCSKSSAARKTTRSLHTEIGLAHAVIGEQRLAGAAQRDAAVLQHIGGGGELERDRDVLLDEKTGQAVAVELANGAQHLLHDGGRQTERGLVEHDE